jgi:hypothetical protein
MLLHPDTVTFGDLALDHVLAVAIDRAAARLVADHGDLGPHVAFADVPEQRVTLTLTRRPARPEVINPRPGDQAGLAFTAAAGAADAARVRITATCVLREVRHDLTASGSPRQTITFIAVSPDGLQDPVTIETI